MDNSLQTLSEEQFFIINEIKEEYEKGMLALNSLPPNTVTFYGGAQVKPGNAAYTMVEEIARAFAEKKWGIVSGGGPGIMAASMQGAQNSNGISIGFRIKLKSEEPVVKTDVDILFKHFSVRKFMLRQSDVFIYAPGGLGTLDELMENLTLMKTNKFPIKPIFLLDSKFWGGYVTWFEDMLLRDRGVITKEASSLFKLVDTKEDVMKELGL